jgi:hypothetical protein
LKRLIDSQSSITGNYWIEWLEYMGNLEKENEQYWIIEKGKNDQYFLYYIEKIDEIEAWFGYKLSKGERKIKKNRKKQF